MDLTLNKYLQANEATNLIQIKTIVDYAICESCYANSKSMQKVLTQN